MKRVILALTCLLVIFALLSCACTVLPDFSEVGDNAKVSTLPAPLFIIPPSSGDYDFYYIDTTAPSGKSTEYYVLKSYSENDRLRFRVKDGCAVVERSKEGGNDIYTVDGRRYISVQNPDYNNIPFYKYYSWTFDRRYFYEYAATESGGKIYNNLNVDSMEALIYAPDPETELLLIEYDSALAKLGTYSIDDFAAVILAGYGFDRAAHYKDAFKAHTTGEGAAAADPEMLYESNCGMIRITFECKSVPGLRYSFNLMWDDEMCYVYSRAGNKFVSFKPDYSLDTIFSSITESWAEYGIS